MTAAPSWWGRVAEWRTRWAGAPAPSATRWVVLDVESTGLDPTSDRLLAIAAIALRFADRRGGDGNAPARPVIELADSFDAVLRPEGTASAGAAPAQVAEHDKANILVHGIGVGAMRAGHEPAEVLRRFAQWAGDAPRLGFHVAFDRALIERAERRYLGRLGHLCRTRPALWIDIEPLAAIAQPEVGARGLDEWLAHFAIPCLQRHQAIADTLATAELLLRLWPRLAREGGTDAGSLARLAAARRWVSSRS